MQRTRTDRNARSFEFTRWRTERNPRHFCLVRADHEWQVAAASTFQYPADWRGLFSPEPNAVLYDRVILQNPMKPFAISILIAIAPLLAGAGGKYSTPYALFEAGQRRPAADTRPAFIMRIDETYVKIGTNDPIAPGNHEVELSIPGTPGSSQSTRVKMTIEAKPCTRYYFAAQRSTRSARDWEAFVAGSESIRECVKRFPDAK